MVQNSAAPTHFTAGDIYDGDVVRRRVIDDVPVALFGQGQLLLPRRRVTLRGDRRRAVEQLDTRLQGYLQ